MLLFLTIRHAVKTARYITKLFDILEIDGLFMTFEFSRF